MGSNKKGERNALKKLMTLVAAATAALSIGAYSALAVEIQVQGEGGAPITQDVAQVQSKAQQEALRSAIVVALDRVMGQGASMNPAVQEKMGYLLSQLSIYKIKQADTPRREADRYVISTLLTIDDAKFRKLLSDAGIASGTATVRASAILTVMDEFFTTPSDLNNPLPLKEVTVYKYDRDASSNARESLSAKASASGSLSARGGESGSVSNAHYSTGGAIDSSARQKGQLNYSQSSSASDSEHAFFQNIKEWQPKNSGPAKESYTAGALGDAFRTYDIRSLSNDLFRSKYFGNQAITIEKLENSQDLAKYVKFAKADAKADFFAVGTSVIVDRGVSSGTGRNTCDGMVVVKVYSTTDGETIASSALTESASGNSPDQCRANVAKKAGLSLGEHDRQPDTGLLEDQANVRDGVRAPCLWRPANHGANTAYERAQAGAGRAERETKGVGRGKGRVRPQLRRLWAARG